AQAWERRLGRRQRGSSRLALCIHPRGVHKRLVAPDEVRPGGEVDEYDSSGIFGWIGDLVEVADHRMPGEKLIHPGASLGRQIRVGNERDRFVAGTIPCECGIA